MSEFEGLTKTSLYSVHQERGAKLAPFAGWVVPLEYEGTLAEHRAVREDVGVFDVSHLGTVFVRGGGALDAVAACFTNDPRDLDDGQAHYTLCCDEDGGIVDDLIAYRLAGDRFLVIPNAANTAAVVDVLRDAAADRGAEVEDASTGYAILAVQGPRSIELAHRLFPDAGRLGFQEFAELSLGPSDTGWYCRTGYTGEVGVELVLPWLDAPGYFRELVELGATPCGLGARDTLRLEMGYPLHGNDLSPDIDPFEARLGWAVDLDRDAFRGRDALRERKEKGPSRRLWGLRATDRGIPRPGMTVSSGGSTVGTVTSGTFSPTLRTGIGMAYLDDPVGPGAEVTVDVREREHRFAVVKPPFVDADPHGA
ncbi:MAG: glycine cleavage system aminomethyltransferase GcvT [Nitriliruptorales bacterium]